MAKTFQSRPIRKTEIDLREKKIDILIAFHGQYEKVWKLLNGIWRSVKSNPYQIYLIDDCSPNETFSITFNKAPWTKIKRNDKQEGFGASLAKAFNDTHNDYVLFMHSDCYIEDFRWINALLKSYLILKEQNVGIVSARTNNPGDHVSSKLKTDCGKYDDDIILEDGFVPLYCALCERAMFQYIKGFIKPYPYAGFEDEELAYRMKKFGLKQGISGQSWVGHECGATINALLKKDPSLSKIMFEDNREKCLEDLRNLK